MSTSMFMYNFLMRGVVMNPACAFRNGSEHALREMVLDEAFWSIFLT